MTAFEDKVNAELPRRPALQTPALTGYDGNPNDGAAPEILDNAPPGTMYLRDTPKIFYDKEASGPGNWIERGSGGASGGQITSEPITVAIDPASIVPQPPAGTVFSDQAEADDYLDANGGTAFKHIRDFTDFLPSIIAHTVTVNLAAGYHRPRLGAGSQVINIKRVRHDPGELIISGVPVAEYTTVHAGGTIRSHQTLNEVTGVNDPYVVCDPGTFPDDNSLAGRYAVFSNGFYSLIWKHDDKQLWLIRKLNPVPVDDSTTVAVKKQASILQNSYDGITRSSSVFGTWFDLGNVSRSYDSGTDLNDLLYEPFNCGVPWVMQNSRYVFTRFTLDNLAHATEPYQFGWRFQFFCDAVLYDCSAIGSNTATYAQLELAQGSTCQLHRCYIQGGKNAAINAGGGAPMCDLWNFNSVIRDVGDPAQAAFAKWYGAITSYRMCGYNFQDVGYGVIPTIADCKNNAGGFFFANGSYQPFAMRFQNVNGPAFRIHQDATVDMREYYPTYIADGLDDVGYDVIGARATLGIDSYSELSGTAGDVRFVPGTPTLFTYAELTSEEVVKDEYENMVRYGGYV